VITVVSTAFAAPTEHLCRASVRAQLGGPYEHLYVDAATQPVAKTCAQNLYEMISPLPPETIVGWLDGDDFLYRENALLHVQAMHDAGALLTYGQYMTSDGVAGHCQAYVRNDYRREPWYASHLKTFRAGLFQLLTPEDLQLDGEWLSLAVDVAVMIPMMELAQPDRVLFCEEVLCVYHLPSSFEASASPESRAREKMTEARVRAKARKERG
jgi:hypothetical protein